MEIYDVLDVLEISHKSMKIPHLEKLLNDLGAFLDKDPLNGLKEYSVALKTRIKKAQDKIHKIDDEKLVIDYYKNTDHFLYELALAESSFDFSKRFKIIYRFIKKNKIKKIADFGGGIGGFVLKLREKNLHTDYIDLDSMQTDFAEYRFHSASISNTGRCLNDLPKKAQYELITSFEVIEHLFDVESILKKISKALLPNGYFICQASFYGEGDHLKKNHKYNDIHIFSEAVKRANMKIVGLITKKSFLHLSLPAALFNLFQINRSSGRKIVCRKVL